MLETGDFWHIKLFGLTYFRKPPGMPWAIAASSMVFGESPLAARIPSAVAAILMSVVAWWYARRWFGENAGVFAGLAQALFPLMWSPGRTAEIEMINNLGTQLFALGLIDVMLGSSRAREESEDDEHPLSFLRALSASARDCLLPILGLLIAALAKGPASAPVLGGVLLGSCLAARSLRPLRSPGLTVILVLAGGAITLLGLKIYYANTSADAVREDVAGQFLWSGKRLLGVAGLIPVAFASALPLSLSLLVPRWGTSSDRAHPIARALAYSWLLALLILIATGVSKARYAMPAAVLIPPLAPLALRRLAELALASTGTGYRKWAALILARPAFWLGLLGFAAWWNIALTSISPSPDQRAGVAAAEHFASLASSGQLWADDAIEARPDMLRLIERRNPFIHVKWARAAMRAGELPPPGNYILIRTDTESHESERYNTKAPRPLLQPRGTIQAIRTYRFALYEVVDPPVEFK
jgi:4-amino-4-deoxy-L-arabinose transferase-like glycosyltransferase